MIRYEPSTNIILAWCSDCPSWRELHDDQAQAHAAGSRHEAACHPGIYAARNATSEFTARQHKTPASVTTNTPPPNRSLFVGDLAND